MSFQEAKDQCEEVGARLCTSEEVSNGEVQGTVCGLAKKHVWTATDDECEEGYAIAQARNPKKLSFAPRECKSKTQFQAYRSCCADHSVSCSELGWEREGGSITVCGTTSIDGCSGPKTYDEAQMYCRRAGARLCTSHEMLNNEPNADKEEMCAISDQWVWVNSNGCPEGQAYAQAGSGSNYDSMPMTCRDKNTAGPHAACCSREEVGVLGTIEVSGMEEDTFRSNQELLMEALGSELRSDFETEEDNVIESVVITRVDTKDAGRRRLLSTPLHVEYMVYLDAKDEIQLNERSNTIAAHLRDESSARAVAKTYVDQGLVENEEGQFMVQEVRVLEMPSFSPRPSIGYPVIVQVQSDSGSNVMIVALAGAVGALMALLGVAGWHMRSRMKRGEEITRRLSMVELSDDIHQETV
jgi:hypothetical protein